MARSHGRISSGIWEDEDFLKLTQEQQRLYLFLISQPNLNHAGLLPLTLRRWSHKAHGLTAADLEKHLQALADARFVVIDYETEELLIRSFVRNDGVWRMPRVMGAMVSGALEISSPALRRALLAEMDRIPLHELSDEPTNTRAGKGPSIRRQVAEHIETLRRAWAPNPPPSGGSSGGGSATPSGTPSGTPSDTPAEEDPQGSTRGRAGAQTRVAPSPTPAPNPYSVGGDRPAAETEPAAPEGVDSVGAANAAAPMESVTAHTLVTEWVASCAKRPPSSLVGHTAREIKNLLDDGIDPEDIRRGLTRWAAKGCSPSTIPSFVNEAMNAQRASNVIAFPAGHTLDGTDATVAGWLNLPTETDQEIS